MPMDTHSRNVLMAHAMRLRSQSIEQHFVDQNRVDFFTLKAAGLTLDASKQQMDRLAWKDLLILSKEVNFPSLFLRMVNGEHVNTTEQRPALHTLLRGTITAQNRDKYKLVYDVLARLRILVESIRSGSRRGASGQSFTDIINIGIGGSDLGPRMACKALREPNDRLRSHFLANVDPYDLEHILEGLDPNQTFIIICSKSFTTEETLTNSLRIRRWLTDNGVPDQEVYRHIVAITTNLKAAQAFGLNTTECFPIWDWVGGRYSICSAIGLIIAVTKGWRAFELLLNGAFQMDQHTLSAPPDENLPMWLALFEYWNTRFLGASSHAVLPYSQRLQYLPDFLQQLTMESNGKRVTLNGDPLEEQSAPILWGSVGTLGQHSFYQLLHQGTRSFSADLILPLTYGDTDADAYLKLTANALAQSRTLMIGRSRDKALEMAQTQNLPLRMAPHFEMPGNRPHNLIMLDALGPSELGALIAAYEHRTFFLANLLNINPFDQWGVELGKEIGRDISDMLRSSKGLERLDASTHAAAKLWLERNS